MNKLSLCVLMATGALIAAGAETAVPAADQAKTSTVKRVFGRAAKYRRTGGFVKKPGTAQGKAVFLNAQKRVPLDRLGSALGVIDNRVHIQIESKDVEKIDVASVGAAVRATGAKLGVAIIDAPNGLPALMTAPEEGWAVVNVAKLAADSPAADVLAARTRKEMLRAFALIGGAAFMARDPIVMRADIRSVQDLDAVRNENYGADSSYAMSEALPRLGIMPWRVATYLLACQEGWAPAPTNDFQKAIWEKTHELPKTPLKLEK